jgi:hypothetical protein
VRRRDATVAEGVAIGQHKTSVINDFAARRGSVWRHLYPRSSAIMGETNGFDLPYIAGSCWDASPRGL